MRLTTILAVIGLAFIATLEVSAQSVRVIFVSGQAELQRPEEPALRPAVKGETVIIGTRIVTGADGRLVLTPMPGVKSIVTPNTTLLLESVSENRTSDTNVTHQAVLELKSGNVISDLQKPEGVTYDYGIRTARGLAGARGTTFAVGINAAGIQTISVTHGSISLSFADGRTATLAQGQLSISKPGGEAQSVAKVDELPPEDQAAVQEFANLAIAAIADAVENGIELDPAALSNALDSAKSLGVTLTPETQTTIERVLSNPSLFKTEEAADPLKTVVTQENKDEVKEIVTRTETTTTDTPTPPPSALEVFRGTLSAQLLAVFNTLPSDIQTQLVTLNDLDIATLALTPDPDTGLRYTDQDLRVNLAGFAQIKPETLAFIKTLAGNNLANIDYVPGPLERSQGSFDRSLASFNALTDTERSQIITMGAAESILDTSPAYISALLASLDSTERSIIEQTGWGYALHQLTSSPSAAGIFDFVSSELTTNDLALVKFFDVDPFAFNENQISSVLSLLGTLSSLTEEQRTVLKQINTVDFIINSLNNNSGDTFTISEFPDFEGQITNTLNFYNSLSAAEQLAVRAIGIGDLLFFNTPDTILNEGGQTALQLVKQLTAFYLSNPDLQQVIQDSRIFEFGAFIFSNSALDETIVRNTLTTYSNLPERTRIFINEADQYSFFEIVNPEFRTNVFNHGPYRSITEINTLLSSLSAGEFGTLSDLDLGRVIIEQGFFEGDTSIPTDFLDNPSTEGLDDTERVQTLKSTLAFFTQLPTDQKFVMRELGVIGDGNVAFVGADTAGLSRLLTAYSVLPGSVRASTERLNEFSGNFTTFGNSNNADTKSFFFPSSFDRNHVIQDIAFISGGDLHVGATRYLRLESSEFSEITFQVGTGKDLHLYASDLIDLNGTTFSSNIRGITMAAATLNLANINFPDTSVVSLNSKLGQLSFGPSTTNGMVNFSNVRYGGNLIESPSDLTNPSVVNGNIVIGTLTAPAPLPTHNPVQNPL